MQLLPRQRFVTDSYRCMDCTKPQSGSSGYPSGSHAAFLVCSITVVSTSDYHHPMPCIALFIANIFYSATFEHHSCVTNLCYNVFLTTLKYSRIKI